MTKPYRPASGDQPAAPENGDSVSPPLGMAWLSLAAGLLFMIMGSRSAIQDYADLDKLFQVDGFKATPARWIKVDVRPDSGSTSEYYPDVLYEYFVEGKSIWGWRLSYEDIPRSKSYWEKRLHSYRAEDTVTAYYSPRDPKEALVERRNDGLLRPVLKVGMGAAFALVGLVLTLVPLANALARLRRKKPAKK